MVPGTQYVFICADIAIYHFIGLSNSEIKVFLVETETQRHGKEKQGERAYV